MTVRSVLIVEDHVEFAENLAEIVGGWGFRAITALSAEDSLRKIESDPSIDIVLTDYRLPGLNGAQLIAELRRRGHQMPVIVMSIYAEELTVDLGNASGALTMLGKPIDFRRLLSSLSAVADFLIPGCILFALGVLNVIAFFALLRRQRSAWLPATLALGGMKIWFLVEIGILRQLHWLHAMWGLPVLLGAVMATPLLPLRRRPARDGSPA